MSEHARSPELDREADGILYSAGLRQPSSGPGIATPEDIQTPAETSMFVERLLNVHEYERKRIGQELHDSTGQMLVSLQMSVARLRSIDQSREHDDLIDEIQNTVKEIDHEIRALAFLHHPTELGGRTLCEAVASLVRGFSKRTGIRIRFKTLGASTGVTDSISRTLLRVAQEALVNVHRHSHASSAKVTLDRQVDRVLLTVSDDGIGIDSAGEPTAGRGIGLEGMRYRVEMQGGRFNVRKLKHGTKISAAMPLVA